VDRHHPLYLLSVLSGKPGAMLLCWGGVRVDWEQVC
jgi:hypothetical protein